MFSNFSSKNRLRYRRERGALERLECGGSAKNDLSLHVITCIILLIIYSRVLRNSDISATVLIKLLEDGLKPIGEVSQLA